MRIGILKETKSSEKRVALVPLLARELVGLGHKVRVQKNAGVGSGFPDEEYRNAGAQIVASTSKLISQSDLVIKVKEPTSQELDFMRPGQLLFCYLHLAAIPAVLKKILRKKIIALGYETLQLPNGRLPLLAPMSEIAGKLAAQVGAHLLRADQGGRGVLLGGTQTVEPATVVVLGAGVVGENALRIAVGLGAKTHVVDVSETRLNQLKEKLGGAIVTHLSTPAIIASLVREADLLIGAVLIPGARAPKLVTEAMVKTMKKGSVIIDVAVDQGGCIATSRVTTHAKPTFVKHGVLHYGVANMPGVVPVTGTLALTHAIFPYIRAIANDGLEAATEKFPELKSAINCAWGKIVHPGL